MNRALWSKSIVEARLLLIGCLTLMFVFQWVFIWVTSLINLEALRDFLRAVPDLASQFGIEIGEVATVTGRVSMAYVDPVVVALAAIWGISRGSDVVAGEINRGTMEMLLAQPVRRAAVMLTPTIVTVVGALLLAVVAWLGTLAGTTFVELDEPVSLRAFVPAATNLFSLIFFVSGVATLVSSFDSYRWRTIGIMGTYYILSLVLEVMGKSAERLSWVRNFTFLGIYEPQVLVTTYLRDPAEAWRMALQYDLTLLGLGTACFAAALVVFCRRDVPAPL